MARVELDILSNAYARLGKLMLDMQQNADLWAKLGPEFRAAASEVSFTLFRLL